MSQRKKLIVVIAFWWKWLDNNSALLVIVLAIVAMVSAFFGTLMPSLDAAKPVSITNIVNLVTGSFYEGVQTTLMNMDPHRKDFNLLIGLARVSSVLLVTLIAIKAIGRLFKDSATKLRLSIGGKGNILVCGLGRIGMQLTNELLQQGELVVVDELTAPNHWTRAVEKAGAIVVQGDVTDLNGLREHVYREPKTIYLVTGNDHANITALANIRKLRADYEAENGKKLSPVNCIMHIADAGLEQAVHRSLMEQDANVDNTAEVQVQVFNIFGETSRQLIVDRLTLMRPRYHDEVAFYVVFGFGQMGKAMVKELAEYAHFENQKRARILVLTDDAATNCDEFLAQWGRFSPRVVHGDISHVQFDVDCDDWSCQTMRPLPPYQVAEQTATEYAANVNFCEFSQSAISSAFADGLAKLFTVEGVKPIALFCFDEDETNFRLANELNDALQDFHGINLDFSGLNDLDVRLRQCELPLPIFVFLPRSRALREIVHSSQDKYPLHPFGEVSEGLERAHDKFKQLLAIDIAWAFENEQSKVPVAERKEYESVWRKKPFWDRHSNLAAAEHFLIKVQFLGCRLSNVESESALDLDSVRHEDRALLAVVEHNRWMAERLLLGWSYGSKKSSQPPRRPSLCAKPDLDPDELQKDFSQIRAVLEQLSKRGYKLVKDSQLCRLKINEPASL